MVKKLLTLLFTSVLAFPLSMVVFVPEAPAQEKVTKQARWEGVVMRSNKDKSTLTVGQTNSHVERTVQEGSPLKRWELRTEGQKGRHEA